MSSQCSGSVGGLWCGCKQCGVWRRWQILRHYFRSFSVHIICHTYSYRATFIKHFHKRYNQVIKDCNIRLFAVDAPIYITEKDYESMLKEINDDLNNEMAKN